MTNSVLARVLTVIGGVAGPSRTPSDAGPDTPLSEGGFWLDSVEIFEVIVGCEEAFGIELDPDSHLTPEALRDPRHLAQLIQSILPPAD